MSSNVISIRIKKFDVEKMRGNKNIYIVGPQYSGKSTLLKNLLYYINNPFCLLVHPNEFATSFYNKILPDQCKIDDLTIDVLEKFIGRQKLLLEFNKTHRHRLDDHACLILDACDADFKDLKWDKHSAFKFLFRSGKNANITTIFTSSYPLKMPPHYYSAIDYVFILSETNKKHQRELFNMFGGMFTSLDQFTEIMKQCTRDYGCLVIDRTKTNTQNLEEQVFWYRANPKNNNFYLGSQLLWEVCYHSSISLDDLLTKPLVMYSKKN